MPLGKVFPTGITETSATFTDLAQTLNEIRIEDGMVYRLAKAGAAIAAKTVVMAEAAGLDSDTATSSYGLTVVVTTGVTVAVVGANNTGAVITDTHYFWMLVDGIVSLTGDAALADGESIMPAAAGAVDTYAAAATGAGNVYCGIALQDSPADPFATLCQLRIGAAGNSLAA